MVSAPGALLARLIASRSDVPAPAAGSALPLSSSAVVVTTMRWLTSKAPMSGWASREKPRWSVAGAPALLPASMAGLPASRAFVWVGPPLSPSEPSFGSSFAPPVPVRSVPPKPVEPSVSPIRLVPCEVKVPSTSSLAVVVLVLPAMMVFLTLTVPDWFQMPPPTRRDWLLKIVELSSVVVPPLLFQMPPASLVLETLPEMVLLVTFRGPPWFQMAQATPPPPAWFADRVVLMTLTVPPPEL